MIDPHFYMQKKPPSSRPNYFISLFKYGCWEGWIVWVVTEFEVFDIFNSLSSR